MFVLEFESKHRQKPPGRAVMVDCTVNNSSVKGMLTTKYTLTAFIGNSSQMMLT